MNEPRRITDYPCYLCKGKHLIAVERGGRRGYDLCYICGGTGFDWPENQIKNKLVDDLMKARGVSYGIHRNMV